MKMTSLVKNEEPKSKDKVISKKVKTRESSIEDKEKSRGKYKENEKEMTLQEEP